MDGVGIDVVIGADTADCEGGEIVMDGLRSGGGVGESIRSGDGGMSAKGVIEGSGVSAGSPSSLTCIGGLTVGA